MRFRLRVLSLITFPIFYVNFQISIPQNEDQKLFSFVMRGWFHVILRCLAVSLSISARLHQSSQPLEFSSSFELAGIRVHPPTGRTIS